MKRRITYEQLQQLDTEQQKKIKELWRPIVGDICANEDCIEICITEYVEGEYTEYFSKEIQTADCGKIEIYNADECLPLLDISQMIEILTENNSYGFDLDGKIYFDWYDGSDTKCLCDALWESVKKILKGKQGGDLIEQI